MKFSIALQAGGSSTRMGQDKGLVNFQGQTMAGYILDQIDGFGDETYVISNQPEAYRQFNLPVYVDAMPGMGALGGIYTALFYAKFDVCLLLACDMPFVNLPLVEKLIDQSSGYDAVIPRIGTIPRPEPFKAVYRKTCLGPIKESLTGGQLRIRDFFEDVNVHYFDEEEIIKFDPEKLSFTNANTPDELLAAEKAATNL